jgi:DNA repair photolyase
VGFTVTTIDDELRQRYEPGASSVEKRLSALESLADEGIDTWAFLGPIMPYITDRNDGLEALIAALKKTGIGYLMVDRLNIKRGMRPRLLDFVKKEFPELESKYRALSTDYFEGVKLKINRLCNDQNLRVEFCY